MIVPVPPGAVKATLIELESITVAVPMVGGPVNVLCIIVDVVPVAPAEFFGVITYVYGVLAVNPVFVNVVPVLLVDTAVPFLVIVTLV